MAAAPAALRKSSARSPLTHSARLPWRTIIFRIAPSALLDEDVVRSCASDRDLATYRPASRRGDTDVGAPEQGQVLGVLVRLRRRHTVVIEEAAALAA